MNREAEGRGQTSKVRLAASACMNFGRRRIDQGGFESERMMIVVVVVVITMEGREE